MSISLDIFFDPLNWIFSSCLSEPNIVKVGDYTVTSKGGGFAGHIHKPLDIDHDDSSFVWESTLFHQHGAERIVLTEVGSFKTIVDAGHTHEYEVVAYVEPE